MTLSVAEETNTFSAGDNKACSNGRSRKNKYSSGERIRTRNGGFSKKRPLCNGSGQGEELLCLWRIWAYGLSLQKLRKGSRWKKAEIWRGKNQGKSCIREQFKRGGEFRIPQLDSHNRFNVLAMGINAGTSELEGSKKEVEVRKVEGRPLREVTVKIGLEKIDMQEGIMGEALLDSRATRLVMSLKFVRKQGFKLKRLKRPMHVRNMDSSLNKEKPIEHMVEVSINYQGHRERMEIDVIGRQK